MAGRVIVVGSTNTDLVVRCARLPRPGETVLGGDLLTFAGGKGANQAVAAARAGAAVLFIGAFGADDFGAARRADLEREGVDCAGCVSLPGAPSGVALIALAEAHGKGRAENLILVAPGANARLSPRDLRRGMPRDLCGRDVVLCSLEVPLATVRAALMRAWRGGARTILNPAPFPAKGLPAVLVRHAHYLTPNETEFEGIVGAPVGSPAARKRCAALPGFSVNGARCPRLVVTRGARGVDEYREGRYYPRAVAAPKVKPVDTVGAGDCFNGCLAAYIAMHVVWPASGRHDPRRQDAGAAEEFGAALRFAVAAAALKVTKPGAQAGMPRQAEILRLMRRMPAAAGCRL
jgi:ribokinase